MAEDNSWLPLGWTSEVKLYRNGRKYKCYVDPSHVLKFHSKPDVLRYLNNEELNNPKSQEKNDNSIKPKSQEKHKLNVNCAGKNFVGLPPGWIKEVRVTKKGRSIRKDSYYTDPVSGHIFRSLKDVERYLKTGELGRHAYKPKDKIPITVELGDDKLSELSDNGTNGQISKNQCSKLAEIVKDEEILSFTSRDDHIGLTKHDSDQCCEGALTSINQPQTKSLEQIEGKGESNLHTPVSVPVVGVCPGKILENGVESQGSNGSQRRTNKSNGKKAPDMPRRASKRLAGIELDPAPELKTNKRTRRLATRLSDDAETNSSNKFHDLATPEEHSGKLVLEPTTNEKSGLSIVLPLTSLPVSEKQAGEEEPLPISEEQAGEEEPLQISKKQTGEEESLPISEEKARVEEPASEADMKPGSPLNLSLTDLWTDPCIEFAIKTLTGAIPVGDENKADENPVSSLDLPFGELWTDPCIEFAVKTLTGAIPVGEDLDIQNFFQQHVSSSDSQGVGGGMLPNVDNFSQTDYLSQHFDGVENKQQAPVASKLLHTGNRSFQNSAGTGLHLHVEGRSSGERP